MSVFDDKTMKNLSKINQVVIIIVIALFMFGVNIAYADKVIDYGFEDWTGDADTTPGYIYGSDYLEYWNAHKAATEIILNGDSDCVGDAHSGDYYFHQQIQGSPNVPLFDACGDIEHGSVQAYNQVVSDANYPPDSGNDIDLLESINSDTMLTRFWFRTTGNWKTQIKTTGGNMGYNKFIRFITAGHGGVLIMLRVRDEPTTTFYIWDSTDLFSHQFDSGIDLTDGEWHSIVVRSVVNNRDPGSVTQTVWWDDWEMEGDGFSREVFVGGLESGGIFRMNIIDNWSATYPTTLMGIDIDDIEVWDGLPGEFIRADVDQNSYINTTDAMLTLRNSLGLSMNGTAWQTSDTTGDVNCDGTSNSTDAMLIIRHSLGLSMVGSGWCEN